MATFSRQDPGVRRARLQEKAEIVRLMKQIRVEPHVFSGVTLQMTEKVGNRTRTTTRRYRNVARARRAVRHASSSGKFQALSIRVTRENEPVRAWIWCSFSGWLAFHPGRGVF